MRLGVWLRGFGGFWAGFFVGWELAPLPLGAARLVIGRTSWGALGTSGLKRRGRSPKWLVEARRGLGDSASEGCGE